MRNRTKVVFLVAGILLAACAAAYSFRDRVLGPVVGGAIVRTVSAELGLDIAIEGISGSYVRDLRLSGVRTVKASDTGMLVSLSADTIHARYSLPLLFEGLDPFLAGLRVDLDGARVEMDFARENEQTPAGKGDEDGTPAGSFVLPVLRAKDSTVDLRGGDWAVKLSGTDIAMDGFDAGKGGIPLTVHAANSVIELPRLHRLAPELRAQGLLRRDSVSVDALDANGTPAVDDARFDYGPDDPFSFSVSFSGFEGSGRIGGLFPEDSTTLEWELRGINVSPVAALFVVDDPLPQGYLTSTGKLSGGFSDPASLAGSVSLDLTEGNIRNIPFKRLALAGSFGEGVLRIESLDAEMGRNILFASGVSAPLAAVVSGDVKETVGGTNGRFSARIEDIPALMGMAGVPVPKQYLPGGVPPHLLVVSGRTSADGLSLETGTFTQGTATVTLERCEVTLPRKGPLLDGLNLSLKLSADIPDAGQTASTFGVEGAGGSLKAEVVLEGSVKDLKGSVELHGENLRYREGRVDSLAMSARSGPDGWRIDRLDAVNGADRLTGSGVLAMDPRVFKDVKLDFSARDFQPYLGWFLSGELPSAQGRLEGHLELAGPPSSPEGSFRVVLTDGMVDGVSVSRGEFAGTMTGESLDIARLEVQTSEGHAELGGVFRHRAWGLPLAGTIDRMTLGKDAMSLKLQEPVAILVDGETSWSFGRGTLKGEAGTLTLGGGVSKAGYDISFSLSDVRSDPLAALFGEMPVTFRGLNLAGSVTGGLKAPDVTVSGSVADLRAPNASVPLAGQLDVRLSSRGIVLNTFSWTTPDGEHVTLTGAIPYDPFRRTFIPGTLDVDGVFSVPDLAVFTAFLPDDLRAPGALNGSLKISGTGEHPEAAVDLHAVDVRFPATAVVRPPGPVTVDAVATFKDNDLRITTLTVHGKDLSISVSGDWRDAGDLMKGARAYPDLPGTLDLHGTVAVPDMGWMGRGVTGIRRLSGKVEGSVAVSGKASKPDLQAELKLTDGEFRAEGTMPALRDLQAQVTVDRRAATVERFAGTVAGSPFSAEGTVSLPSEGVPQADLRIQGANVLLYRSEGVSVRADADIAINGPVSGPAFSGTVALTDARLRKNVNWLAPLLKIGRAKAPAAAAGSDRDVGFSFHSAPMKDATFDIHVTSKKPVEIRSNVARGALRPDLRLKGTGEIPVITGVVYIDPSRIMLPAGRFSVDSGVVRFLESSPGRPVLQVSGSSRILGYDVQALVEGTLNEPVITLSSVPPLPQDALILLVLTGKLPAGAGEHAGQAPGSVQAESMRVALYVGKGVLQDWFGEDDLESDEPVLDRLDVVMGRGLSRQGNETIGAQFRLAEDVVRDGDELFLVAERDTYDEYNAGVRIVFRFR